MIFLIIFPKVLSNTIGWKDLGESYNSLLDLGMITIDNNLKLFGQYPKSMHALSILMTLVIQTSSLRMDLRCLHESLSRLEVDKLLQLPNAILNSSLEKGAHVNNCLFLILSRILMLTWRWSAILKDEHFTSYLGRDMVSCHN